MGRDPQLLSVFLVIEIQGGPPRPPLFSSCEGICTNRRRSSSHPCFRLPSKHDRSLGTSAIRKRSKSRRRPILDSRNKLLGNCSPYDGLRSCGHRTSLWSTQDAIEAVFRSLA